MNDKRTGCTNRLNVYHPRSPFRLFLTPKIEILLRGDEVLAVLGVLQNLGNHLVVNFHVKVRAHVAGDEKLRR